MEVISENAANENPYNRAEGATRNAPERSAHDSTRKGVIVARWW